MLPKIDRETLRKLKLMSKEGRKEEVDEALGFVICPQQVNPNRVPDSWTRVCVKNGRHWRVKAWLRDHCAGAFADLMQKKHDEMSDQSLLDLDVEDILSGDYVYAFENPDDAFAFKVRWHGDDPLRSA